MSCRNSSICALFFTFIFVTGVCYEKTLRKIVRNQSKMVQRPFSDDGSINLVWRNLSQPAPFRSKEPIYFPGYSQSKTVIHKIQRPISTILSAIDTNRDKLSYPKPKIRKDYVPPNELRLARNTVPNNTNVIQSTTEAISNPQEINFTYPKSIDVQNFYQIPTHTYFPSKLDSEQSNDEFQEIKERKPMMLKNNRTSKVAIEPQIEESYKPNVELNSYADVDVQTASETPTDTLLLKVKSRNTDFDVYNYNSSVNPYTCTVIQETKADIDAQDFFIGLDIEPPWIIKKQYWDNVFDYRYESLMRNPHWPPLKVILIPRTHVDSIWRKSFNLYHNDTVNKIISNIVKKLQFYNNMTFSWNEVSHLSQWWKTASAKSRSGLRRLVRSGRLEITTGGWVEPDEATSHLFGLVHQLIEGHQWLKTHLNYSPKVAWLTHSVTHSPTMTYLLSACGMSQLVITNLHYSWEKFLAEYQYSDFIWVQSWDSDRSTISILNNLLNKIGNDRYPKHSVLTHYLQFNSAGFKACGPNGDICASDFNFAKLDKNLDINSYNVKEKAEILLEQYSKSGTISTHNVIIAPIGGPYRYEFQPEFDYQFNNYQRLANFVNINSDIYKATVEFGTAQDYFDAIAEKQKNYPLLKGDFLNFADLNSGTPAYWTGFFTSRPVFKILLRRLQSTLRTTEILFSFALSFNAFRGVSVSDIFDLLLKARENLARLLDRNVVSGTLTVNALKYAHKLILTTVKDCWYIQEVAASLLSIIPDKKIPYLQKYVYRDGEFITGFTTVSPGDNIYIFNSLSHERTEILELVTLKSNIRITDHNNKEIPIQVNPVWKYSSDNIIRISRRYFQINFATNVPAFTLKLFKITETYDPSQNAASIYCLACVVDDTSSNYSVFPFDIEPIQTGDIQLESYKQRVVLDELTGFLKTVVMKETNVEKMVVIDYGAFKSSDVNAGMFLFNTYTKKPIHDVLLPFRTGLKSKVLMIISGQITTSLVSIYGRFLQHTIKIFNLVNSPLSNAIYLETKVDYESSPKNRELELFLSIQTDIANGNPPEIITDNNGFQHTARVLNISRRVESNIYPITDMAYIQDHKSRFTFITDHAQGVTGLQEGQLVVMLDRRILYNDGRGTNEGLADSSATYHRNYIFLENFIEAPTGFLELSSQKNLKIPSLPAIYLSNSLNYPLDLFIIDKNVSDLCHYAFLPLIKTPFPCDIAVINYRVILNSDSQHYMPSAALMILHRQSLSCQIDHTIHLLCNGDTSFSLDKILRNVKAIYQTNLSGTTKGIPMFTYNQINLPPMELTTLRIHF